MVKFMNSQTNHFIRTWDVYYNGIYIGYISITNEHCEYGDDDDRLWHGWSMLLVPYDEDQPEEVFVRRNGESKNRAKLRAAERLIELHLEIPPRVYDPAAGWAGMAERFETETIYDEANEIPF